jgi:uncharacterized membrane protein YciS (DUF1049 family)
MEQLWNYIYLVTGGAIGWIICWLKYKPVIDEAQREIRRLHKEREVSTLSKLRKSFK